MSINRWMDKKDVVHIHNGMLLSHKKEWNDAICSNTHDLEIIIPSKVSRKDEEQYRTISLVRGL